MKTLLISLFITLSGIQMAQAGTESSELSTILPGTKITFNRDFVIYANDDKEEISNYEKKDSDGSSYIAASCDFYPQNGSAAYDRKISTGRTLTLTKIDVTEASDGSKYTHLEFDSGAEIVCDDWAQGPISIGRFRSMLSEKSIGLTLNVPEL